MGADNTRHVTSAEDVLRPGQPEDHAALEHLLDASRWTYRPDGVQDTRAHLRNGDSLLWWRDDSLRGAFLYSRYRLPVIEVALLAVRDRTDLGHLLTRLVPRIETYLRALGASWVSLNDPLDWLAPGLRANGYRLKDRVLSYYQKGLDVADLGNALVTVRQAHTADAPAIAALDSTAFEPFWRMNADYIRCSLAGLYALVAVAALQEIVGYLVAERWHNHAYITRLAVLPEVQGQGIGLCLLTEALAAMRRDGLAGAYLNTQEDNIHSRRLYERLGFHPTGEVHDVWVHAL
ncbi:MAG: GNAT family N-acetyltransferase [Anaerolineae bacterium]